jgi:hypothetical protein
MKQEPRLRVYAGVGGKCTGHTFRDQHVDQKPTELFCALSYSL